MSSKKERENAHLGHPESKEKLYNENAECEPARSMSPAETIRVILPDEPPRLNPAAARALLRVLIKAHDRLENPTIRKEPPND
jgi:hypothetical protein